VVPHDRPPKRPILPVFIANLLVHNAQVHEWWLGSVDPATGKHPELPSDDAGGSLSILNPSVLPPPPPPEQRPGTASRSRTAAAPAPSRKAGVSAGFLQTWTPAVPDTNPVFMSQHLVVCLLRMMGIGKGCGCH
jgi:hypothetical protein